MNKKSFFFPVSIFIIGVIALFFIIVSGNAAVPDCTVSPYICSWLVKDDYSQVYRGLVVNPYRATTGLFVLGPSSPTIPELIVTNGNVGIGTTTPAAKLDVAGFFKVEPPGVTQSTYNYQLTQSPPDSIFYALSYENNRCSWAPDDTIWENPPSPDAVPAGDENCYDINNTIMIAYLGICMQSTTPTTVQCPCDTGGSNFQCRNTFNLTCYQESGEIQLTSPLTVGKCYDRGNSGTQYDTYDLFVMIRSYTKVTSTPWGKVSIGSSSQYNNLCLNGDCRSSWPVSSAGTDSQTLSISGTALSISNGNSVTLPSGSGGVSSINGNTGAMTFNGAGVSQSGNTFTFTGGAGGDGLGTGNTGNTGYITKWTGPTAIGDSVLQQASNGNLWFGTTNYSGTSHFSVAGSNQKEIYAGSGYVGFTQGAAIWGNGQASTTGVRGENTGTGYGVLGNSSTGIGVFGSADTAALSAPVGPYGVYGWSGNSTTGAGVKGRGNFVGGQFESNTSTGYNLKLPARDNSSKGVYLYSSTAGCSGVDETFLIAGSTFICVKEY